MTALNTRLTAESALVEQIEILRPWTPAHELIVTEREVRLSVDLPGVIPQNLRVVGEAGHLHVSAHRARTSCSHALEHRCTLPFGDSFLEVAIPDWVDLRRAYQTFEAGILTVVLPRRRESRPRTHGPLL